jgi:hypothetical protein
MFFRKKIRDRCVADLAVSVARIPAASLELIPLHTSLLLDLAHVPDAGNEVHYSLHA